MRIDPIEAQARKILRRTFLVEAVRWLDRWDDEFAALVLDNANPAAYERALEWLTTPGCPVTVVREREGRLDTRIYVKLTNR